MNDVFVSYSHKDRLFVVDQLKPALESNKFEGGELVVWVDERIPPNHQEWFKDVKENLLQSNVCLFVVSEKSLSSIWCQIEIAEAREQGKRLIPVALEQIDDPRTLF